MGRKINVVLPSGRVVAVDEDVAQAAGNADTNLEAQQRLAGQETERLNAERSSGVVEGGKAALEGAADALTFGGYGAARRVLDPEGARNMQIRGQERSGARFLGEAAAMAIPGLGEAGMLGKAGTAAEYTAPGLARAAGEFAGGGLGGQAVEGAILGVGGYISQANITGDPLTIESAMADATVGGLLNVGMHLAASKMEGVAWSGKLKDAQNAELKRSLDVAKKGKQVFNDTPPSWDELAELHDARKKSVSTFNKAVAKEAEEYDGFWQNNAKLTKAIDETDDLLAHVQNNVYAKQGGPFGGDPAKVKYNLDSTGNARQVQYTYESGAKVKVGFEGEEGQQILKGPAGESVPAKGTPQVREMQYTADGRPVISDPTLEKIKEYRARISQVYQKKGGGWRMDSGKWIRDPSIPADPRGAMENLRAIQEELKQWRPQASGMMKTQLPMPARSALPEIPGELPRSIEDFARKHAEQVNVLGQSMQDPQMAAALERVLKDLDLLDPTTPKSPVENLTALHETLRTYRGKMQEMTDYATKLEAEEDAKPAVLKWLRKAVRYTAGRAADTGGAWGAVRRQIGGSLAMRGMAAVEGAALGYGATGDADGAALGAALMAGRMSMRGRIRNLVLKHSASGAALSRQLGSPLAYLTTSFVTGEKDTERDPRKAAINRITEIQSATMTAPDTAFMALQGMLGQPHDIAWKMHQHVVGSLNYLMSTLPKDPGLNTKLFSSNWTPAYHETVALAHRLEAVNDPLTAISRAIAGNSHPAATEALWAVYPAVMNELANELSVAAPNLKNLTYEQASAYSNLFRTPLTGLQQPVVVTTIQGLYMNGSSAAPQTAGPAGGAPKKAPGRPAAVQSSVAGSSVANLTSN